jgi:MscS family membrane protein
MLQRIIQGLQQSFMGNTWASYCWAAGILLLGFALKKAISVAISRLIFRLVKKESEQVPWSEFVRLLRPPFEFLFSLFIVFLASESLQVPDEWGLAPVGKFGIRLLIHKLFFTVVLVAFTWLGIRFVKFVGLVFKQKALKTESKLDDQLVPFFRDLGILLFVIAMIFIALGRIFAVDVLTLVTSLGIGGLAIALAARETLENLFASFTLMLDRPFTVGDSINVGGTEGTIEKVGFRSTRLRTFDGSLVTLPNHLLTSQSLDNLTERRLRRARYFVRLAYSTPGSKVRAVVSTIQAFLDQHPDTQREPGSVRFDSFGESSLDILIIFFVETVSPREFARIKEEVNLKIIEIVESEEVRFAFPVRELYIRNESLPNTSDPEFP